MAAIQKDIESFWLPAYQGGELRRFTRSECYKMLNAGILNPNEKVELIEGLLLHKMTQNKPHATSINRVQKELMTAFGEGFIVQPQLPMIIDETSEPEPDILVVPDWTETLEDHPTAEHALLLVEIADTSLNYDRKVKGALYAKAGIKDYWILNLPDRCLEVYQEPTELSAGTYEYKMKTNYTEEETVSPLVLPEKKITIKNLLPIVSKKGEGVSQT